MRTTCPTCFGASRPSSSAQVPVCRCQKANSGRGSELPGESAPAPSNGSGVSSDAGIGSRKALTPGSGSATESDHLPTDWFLEGLDTGSDAVPNQSPGNGTSSDLQDEQFLPAMVELRPEAVEIDSPGLANVDRTIVLLLVRLEDLQPASSNESDRWDFTGLSDSQITNRLRTVSSQWQVGNGPGHGFLDRTSALAQLCDAVVQRVIIGPDSQPLDIGRKTRVIPPAIRSALIARDRGCVFNDCDVPAAWCHAHHIQHWAQGGSTALQNLALLCDQHHTKIHAGPWNITITPSGHPKVTLNL